MKLKDRAFPFWAVDRYKPTKYKIFRFASTKIDYGRKKYITDTLVRFWGSIHPTAMTSKDYKIPFAESTVRGFQELYTLPDEFKKSLILSIFNEERQDDLF